MHVLSFLSSLLLVASVAFVSAAPPVDEANTNAKRLAEGKTPLRPRRLYTPSSVESSKRPKRSNTPSTGQFSCCGIFSCDAPACCVIGSETGSVDSLSSTDCYIDPTWGANLGQSEGTCNNAGSPGASGGYEALCCDSFGATGPYPGDATYYAGDANSCYIYGS